MYYILIIVCHHFVACDIKMPVNIIQGESVTSSTLCVFKELDDKNSSHFCFLFRLPISKIFYDVLRILEI
jgi:hypothetical protein